MTVCKTFIGAPLKPGQKYTKKNLFGVLESNIRMASTFFDPARDELYTFFDQNSAVWNNDYQNGIFRFHHKTLKTLSETPAWERTKIRRVFLRPKAQKAGEFTYLGEARDEKHTIASNGHEEKQYQIF
ncbi:MAG: hypothetical protein LBG74_02770 [Spirochaetaceae bacterium]|jgi:hypothetical protein|nr:hypothetical protein [Spirochaetaceae bacterium]